MNKKTRIGFLSTALFASVFFIQNALAVVDYDAPELLSFNASPIVVDTDDAAQVITALFSVSDQTGLNLDSSECQIEATDDLDHEQWLDGVIESMGGDNYKCTISMPVGSMAGSWYFELELDDNSDNEIVYHANDDDYGNEFIAALGDSAIGTVITNNAENQDFVGPAIISFNTTPTTIDTDEVNQNIIATFVVDEPAGLDVDQSDCWVTSEDGVYGRDGVIASTNTDNEYTCSVYFPIGSAKGNWYFDLELEDFLYNESSYDANNDSGNNEILAVDPDAVGSMITNNADNEDRDAPALVAFTAPTNFNTESEVQILTANFVVSEQIKVEDFIGKGGNICNLHELDHNQSASGVVASMGMDGSNFAYSCTIELPIGSAIGNWYYRLGFQDNLGNSADYDAYDYNNFGENTIEATVNVDGAGITTNMASSEDLEAPALTAFSATPTVVNTAENFKEIIATFTVEDQTDIEDIFDESCEIHNNEDWYYGVVQYVNGDTYTCTVNLPAGSAYGEWFFYLSFSDTLHNSVSYDAGGDENEIVAAVADSQGSIITNDDSVVNANVISVSAISGLTAPVTSATPDEAIEETDQFTATVSWNDNPTKFSPNTVYNAIITITPKSGYTLEGVTENFFTVSGAVATNIADSGLVTVVFSSTDPDTTKPTIETLNSITTEAIGAEGAIVTYNTPNATDNIDGVFPATCDVISGSTFPIGTTTVTCSAEDAAGNVADQITFDITVQDTIAPTFSGTPELIEVVSPDGRPVAVSFDVPTANDVVSGDVNVSCSHRSGDEFSVGSTKVTCATEDALGHRAETDFRVVVSFEAVISAPTEEQMTAAFDSGFLSAGEGDEPENTDEVRINVDLVMESGDVEVSLPAGTVVKRADGETFDATKLTTEDLTASIADTETEDVAGVLKVGVPHERLTFSPAITITIHVGSAYEGKTLKIAFQYDDTLEWNDHDATCTIEDGDCIFETDHATTFKTFESVEQDEEVTSDEIKTDVREESKEDRAKIYSVAAQRIKTLLGKEYIVLTIRGDKFDKDADVKLGTRKASKVKYKSKKKIIAYFPVKYLKNVASPAYVKVINEDADSKKFKKMIEWRSLPLVKENFLNK